MKKSLLLLLLLSKISFACQCPDLLPISKKLCENYDVIFSGKVDSVTACSTKGISTAYFTINELYKGAAEQHVTVDFDCSTACMMSFSKEEEWIIYANFHKFNLITINICEHSRKKFGIGEQDIYQITANRTFQQEKEFLRTTLGVQSFTIKNDLNQQQRDFGPRNEQPSPMNKVLLLLVSLAAMGIVYYVTRTKK